MAVLASDQHINIQRILTPVLEDRIASLNHDGNSKSSQMNVSLLEMTRGAIVANVSGAVMVMVVSTIKCRQARTKENSVTK